MIKQWIINWINKKALKHNSFVELSTGRVYLKPLTNGMVNKCKKHSCIQGNTLNDPLFFQLMDYSMTNLTKRQIDNLSISDGTKLRNVVREILMRENVIQIQEEFSDSDKEWFKKSKVEAQAEVQINLKKLAEGTGEIPPGMNL